MTSLRITLSVSAYATLTAATNEPFSETIISKHSEKTFNNQDDSACGRTFETHVAVFGDAQMQRIPVQWMRTVAQICNV